MNVRHDFFASRHFNSLSNIVEIIFMRFESLKQLFVIVDVYLSANVLLLSVEGKTYMTSWNSYTQIIPVLRRCLSYMEIAS